jgi:fatty acid desaturase
MKGDGQEAAIEHRITWGRRAIELGRPALLLAAFVIAARFLGLWAAPLAMITVFAVAILVHDLIHNALRLPKPWSAVALGVAALFLIKSGRALRASHLRHHQLCLSEVDEEGRVAHRSMLRLLVTGPFLALEARFTAFRHDERGRLQQVVESVLNLLTVALLAEGARRGSVAALLYLGAVILVTLSAPIWGAKIPHSLPTDHPLVRWLRDHVGRWTPAASSVVFHELHHRAPRLPVALLAERRAEIEQRPPSPCEEIKPG